ncbi:MAG: hypothetical protein HON04_11365 [Planctomicrobium sp.]|jgi:hypothetical protein|nr:hypothetical protein [Planctomicrobium sp.]
MFSKLTTIASMVAVVSLCSTSANADHHNARYRHLDDLSFAAFAEARELRWEIHDDFVDSHDYEHLLEDADAVIEAMHGLQVAIYRERPDHLIGREVEQVEKKLANLTSHMNTCDYARVSSSRHQTTFNGRGYSFTPETRHVGRIHVVAALRMIHRIESALSALEREVRPHHGRHGHSNLVPPTIEQTPRPAPILVPREARNSDRRYVEIPVGNSSKSGFVFKIGY